MRHAVIVVVVFDVVIDIDARSFPFGQIKRRIRKRSQVRGVQQVEGVLTAAGEFLERTVIKRRQQFGHRGIKLGDREEAPVAKTSQNPALDHLDTHFSLGFVLGLSGSGRQDDRTVVVGEFSRRPVKCRFVAISDGNEGARIIGNDEGWNAADELQCAAHAGEPVVLGLSARSTGKGVA